MIRRSRYCSDRMCGASDCSTCYGPGYDRDDDDDDDDDPGGLFSDDDDEDGDEPDDAEELPCNP